MDGPASRKLAIAATRTAFVSAGCALVRVGEPGHKRDAYVAAGQISLVIQPQFRLAYGQIQLTASLSFVDEEFERRNGRDKITQESLATFCAHFLNFDELRRSAWMSRDNLNEDLAKALGPYLTIVQTYPSERNAFAGALRSGTICGMQSKYFMWAEWMAQRRREWSEWLGLSDMNIRDE